MGKKASKDEGAEPPKWGKGKTDEATWFKPGCKAGPGRPKGSKNARTIWQEANAEKVTVKVNGKTTQVAKGPLKYKQLVGKAASGDLKAIGMAISLDDKYAPVETAPPAPEETAADLAVLDVYIALQQKFAKLPETKS